MVSVEEGDEKNAGERTGKAERRWKRSLVYYTKSTGTGGLAKERVTVRGRAKEKTDNKEEPEVELLTFQNRR